jgi:hypothetical protein
MLEPLKIAAMAWDSFGFAFMNYDPLCSGGILIAREIEPHPALHACNGRRPSSLVALIHHQASCRDSAFSLELSGSDCYCYAIKRCPHAKTRHIGQGRNVSRQSAPGFVAI